ncbi:MAG: double-strand break repair helicase AddA [Sphingomonadaceae bacterium]|nr:double-strand break repair helicase AddA [Sphingomonadaceae bacterium]
MSGGARLTDAQARGADPRHNAWMVASAGTGKTRVLSARVLRLLLDGVAPQSILALTFTKAGAAEMAERIRGELAKWVRLGDKDLSEALFNIHHPGHLDGDVRRRARRLFAEVIDAPGGGPKVVTIHSFCQSLLAAFPEEAGLAPGFSLLDDREKLLLHQNCFHAMLDEARAGGDVALLAGIERLALRRNQADIEKFCGRCAAAYAALDTLPAVIAPWLRGQLGLPSEESADEAICRRMQERSGFRDHLAQICLALVNRGGAKCLGHADELAPFLDEQRTLTAADLDAIYDAIHKKDGDVRVVVAQAVDKFGGNAILTSISEFLRDLRLLRREIPAADLQATALEIGRFFARRVRAAMLAAGKVDYDDLIALAARLLDTDAAAWVRFKLDQRIDHILVDEAQDTNGQQWEIIDALLSEHFALDARDDARRRSLFVVGDSKQAIFGFQGTSPVHFQAAAGRYAKLGDESGRPFDRVEFATNFRSSQLILNLVDKVIEGVGSGDMGLDHDPAPHVAHKGDAPATILVWPPVPKGDTEGASGAGGEDDGAKDADEGAASGWADIAEHRLAHKIARTIRHWIDHGLDGQDVQARDIMILLRSRGEKMRMIVAQLQEIGVPVAGVDRMRLSLPLAVQDLLCSMRFALQPHDDLALANLLTSPLIGWDYAQLDDAAAGRLNANGKPNTSLWRHIQQSPTWADNLEPLRAILNMAGYAGPHLFLETLLSGPLGGRAKLIARLGGAARDPIDELLHQAMQFERGQGHSLHHFLQWFDTLDVEVKRDQDVSSDAVRILSVHGSKGLQAPIVILADADFLKEVPRDPDPILPGLDKVGEVPMLPLNQAQQLSAVVAETKAARTRAAAEYNRLLYVAMTRAERVLCTTGIAPKNPSDGKPSWHKRLAAAAAAMGAEELTDDPIWGDYGSTLRLSDGGKRKPAATRALAHDAPPPLPAWATQPAPVEARPLKPLAPSNDVEQGVLAIPMAPSLSRDAAMRRGTLIHALFERLSGVDAAARRPSALAWLKQEADDLDCAAHQDIVDNVLRVMEDARFAAMFGSDARGEVGFSALVGDRVIAGSIDRLLVRDAAVDIIDFKSGQHVPQDISAVPTGYLRQMAAYVAAISVIFPDHAVRAHLLFTAGPRLLTLDAATLDVHKPKLTTP